MFCHDPGMDASSAAASPSLRVFSFADPFYMMLGWLAAQQHPSTTYLTAHVTLRASHDQSYLDICLEHKTWVKDPPHRDHTVGAHVSRFTFCLGRATALLKYQYALSMHDLQLLTKYLWSRSIQSKQRLKVLVPLH